MVHKFSQEFQEACFISDTMKSALDASGVSLGPMRVPASEVLNSWSESWIVLKFLLEFTEVVFLGVELKLQLETHNVLSGNPKDHTIVTAQKVRNSWSDRSIVLKFL
jgi:hypothetical protein